MNDNEKKKGQSFSEFLNKSADISKKMAKGAYDGTKITVAKIKKANEEHKKVSDENKKEKQREKLAPVFPKDYKSKNFHIPNIIKIVDDAERKGIELCQGAIGWYENVNGVEVLCLYDEAKEFSQLQFVPTFSCDTIYCVDPFDRKRFIKADYIFGKVQEEKLAELEHIAYCLGAKSCSVEIVSSETSEETRIGKITAAISSAKADASKQATQKQGSQSGGKTAVQFEGHNHPTQPNLKWFAFDDTIKNLIEMRCCHPQSIKKRTLELSGASSSTMSHQTAAAIDYLLKSVKVKAGFKAEDLSRKERNSKLLFDIEF